MFRMRCRVAAILILGVVAANAAAQERRGSVVEVDLGGLEDDKESGRGQVMEVVATGVGTDPEKARQNAFSNAIEQAVGVLVDAETLVENDRIVRDEVLTFSRGFVQQFAQIDHWKIDELHYVRIRATVALDELVQRLEGHNVSIREVPGLLLFHQAKHELASAGDAAEMFRRAMRTYGMDMLYTVEIEGAPQLVEEGETHAKLRVELRIAPNTTAWTKFRKDLIPLLARILPTRVTFTTERDRGGRSGLHEGNIERKGFEALKQRLGWGTQHLYVFKKMNPSGSVTTWDAFAIPEAVVDVLADVRERRYVMHVAAKGSTGYNVETATTYLAHPCISLPGGKKRIRAMRFGRKPARVWIGPLLWGINYRYLTSLTQAVDLTLSLEDVQRVTQCVAWIEQVD